MMTVYVVTMYRYGNKDGHSYIDGVYSNLDLAIINAKQHILFRAHKYEAEIQEFYIDSYQSKIVAYIDEVYETEEQLEDDLKSVEDWLKYKRKTINEKGNL